MLSQHRFPIIINGCITCTTIISLIIELPCMEHNLQCVPGIESNSWPSSYNIIIIIILCIIVQPNCNNTEGVAYLCVLMTCLNHDSCLVIFLCKSSATSFTTSSIIFRIGCDCYIIWGQESFSFIVSACVLLSLPNSSLFGLDLAWVWHLITLGWIKAFLCNHTSENNCLWSKLTWINMLFLSVTY